MRFFIPSVLIVAALALFVMYTNPTYQNTKAFAAQNDSYDEALTKSAELHTIRDQLLSKRNSFSNEDVSRLETVLPDNVDNIRLIIDINNIALKNGLTLSNVSLGDIVKNSGGGNSDASSASAIGSVKVGFSVTTSYSNFLSFLHDLEHSLRIIDVTQITYSPDNSAGAGGSYQVQVRTYWLH